VVADRERFFARDAYFASLYASPRARLATAEDLISELDRNGFAAAIALGWGWNDDSLCAMHNEYLADVQRRFPARIVGFACVQPRADRAETTLDRALADGLRGVGELMPHGQGYRLDDRALLAPIVAVASAHQTPIVTHCSEPVGHDYPGKGDVTVAEIVRFVETFPDQQLVCAHWGGGLPFYYLMPEVTRAARNLWFDSAASPYLYDRSIYRVVADLVPRDRILFGTDFPLLGIARCQADVEASGLSDADRDAILGDNAAQLLGLLPR
jgi:predicted TIM-barrel fold metal-dependent hydrolase